MKWDKLIIGGGLIVAGIALIPPLDDIPTGGATAPATAAVGAAIAWMGVEELGKAF